MADGRGEQRAQELLREALEQFIEYQRGNDLALLTRAVPVFRAALAAAVGCGARDVAGFHNNLSHSLRELAIRTNDTAAAAESVRCCRAAVAAVRPGSADHATYLCTLASGLRTLYRFTREPGLLREAASVATRAIDLKAIAPPPAKQYAILGGALRDLYWHDESDLAVLTRAIEALREAAEYAELLGDPQTAAYWCELSTVLSDRYERTEDLAVLAAWIESERKAVAASTGGERLRHQADLGEALHWRFKGTADRDSLAEAVLVARAAVIGVPATDEELPLRLGCLSAVLVDLAALTGDVGLLREAVAAARTALASTQLRLPDRGTLLGDLSTALVALYATTRDSALLTEAVEVAKEADVLGHSEGSGRAVPLVGRAASAQALSGRLGTTEADLRHQVVLLEDALDALPPGHAGRSLCLHNLAKCYRGLHHNDPDPGSWYLDEAIRYARECLAATPADHVDLPRRRITLSDLLVIKSYDDKDPAPLTRALHLARQAVAATAPDDPHYGSNWQHLGIVLRARVRIAGDAGAAAEAWRCFYNAARHPLAPVRLRIRSYQQACVLAVAAGRGEQQGLACIEAAVDLLAEALPAELARTDQEHEIGEVSHLAAQAAQAAVSAGRPDRAVELLERTRGVLVAADLDRRAGHDHRTPLSAGELTAAAAVGPVVYVYASAQRCDALILGGGAAGGVRVVPLPVTERDVVRQANLLATLVGLQPGLEGQHGAGLAAERELGGVLDWLRRCVTEPVLGALGYDRVPAAGRVPPRVWWCPVGLFSCLPLHATCLDEVVSSYAFTGRGLRFARSQPPAAPANDPVVIAVPHAPGVPSLPGAGLESDLITSLLPGAVRLATPTRAAVLDALPGHPIAHFACHADADLRAPGRSRLILDDHVEHPCSLADIAALRLTGGLAFLSACDTAVTAGELSNEAVHLAGAFQLAGYQHVVGTMWRVSDRASVGLVGDFYSGLLTPDGRGTADPGRAATALHGAATRLRERYPDWPSVWAAHIHVGP